MRSHYMAIRALLGFAAFSLAQPVNAAGFYISEIGTPGSLGTAGVDAGGGGGGVVARKLRITSRSRWLSTSLAS